jgi:opacity protein-like surface antigen
MNFKKTLFIVLFFIGAANIQAQSYQFGVTAGLLIASEKAEFSGNKASVSDEGPYLGVYADIPISEKISLLPEVDYANINGSSFGFLSVRAKYNIVPLLFVQAGPQVSYLFEQFGALNKAGIDLGLGAGVDISKHFNIQARYAFELTNRYKQEFDGTYNLNWLHIGLGYTF